MFPARTICHALHPHFLICSGIAYTGPQVNADDLDAGEVVFSDTATSAAPPAVRILARDGSVRTVYEGGRLNYPSGVLIDRDGSILLVDDHGDGTRSLLDSDSLYLRSPQDLAFALDGSIFVTHFDQYESQQAPVAGQSFDVIVESVPTLGSHPVAIFASNLRSEFALQQIWAGAPGRLSLDLTSANQINFTMAPMGDETHLSRTIPTHMAGLALHLQALEPLERLPNAALTFRVN